MPTIPPTTDDRALRPLGRRRRAALALVGVAVSLVATGCPTQSGGGTVATTTTTSIDPALNHPPTIASFAAAKSTGPSPVTTALVWSIADVDGQSLTCSLDLDDNGTADRTVNGCTSASVRAATFTAVGTHPVTLVVSDGLSVATATTNVVVSAASGDPFNITLRLAPGMTATQQAAFTDAAARWSQVIRTGLANTSLNIAADDCGTGAPAFNGAIDDVVIDAAISPIDGVGAVLGQAGPCYVRTTGGLPMYGVMEFDTADVADLEATGDLSAVILHEMGHVLGFGTVWSGNGLVGAGTSDPRFVGQAAVGAWQAISGTGAVPVENSGGAGTADSHWRETVFNGELMTGYIDPGNNPLSAVTIAALSDLGYGVDLGAADPYGLPGLRAGTPAEGRHIDTVLISPKGSR